MRKATIVARPALVAALLALASACRGAQPDPVAGGTPATGTALAVLRAPGPAWDSLAAPGYVIYVRPGTWAARHRASLPARVDDALSRSDALLGAARTPVPAQTLRLFYVESRDDMLPLTGTRSRGWTDAASQAVLLVANAEWEPFERHEVMHAVSLARWGDPRRNPAWGEGGAWLIEGIAAAATDRCQRHTGREVVAHLAATDSLVPFDALTGAFRAQNDLVAYLQAGALVQWLLERHGPAALERIWREGPAALPAAYGAPALAALERPWREWLAATPHPATPVDFGLLLRHGCGWVARGGT